MGFFAKLFGTIVAIGLTGVSVSVYFIMRGSFFAGEPLTHPQLFIALAGFLLSTAVTAWAFSKISVSY